MKKNPEWLKSLAYNTEDTSRKAGQYFNKIKKSSTAKEEEKEEEKEEGQGLAVPHFQKPL
jgi:hypothetical protein